LIVDGPAPGAWNMAVDEALLDSYAADSPRAAPTVRLYSWSPPTLSLGRGQDVSWNGSARMADVGEVDVVRRPTGGGAVLHDDERTYSVSGRLRTPPFEGGVLDTYERLARALARAMRLLGAEAHAEGTRRGGQEAHAVCFEALSSHEISVAGRKLIGSAQVRRRSGFLQHGSILLNVNRQRMGELLGSGRHGERFIDLGSALGRTVGAAEVDAALVRSLEETFDARLAPGRLTRDELGAAERHRQDKYATSSWTRMGRVGRPPGSAA